MDVTSIRGAINARLTGIGRGTALNLRVQKKTFAEKMGQSSRQPSIGTPLVAPLIPGATVLGTALGGIFGEVADGLDDVERTISTNGDPALRTALLSDVQLVKRTLRSMQAKLGSTSPRG